jgi:hypothetical protein
MTFSGLALPYLLAFGLLAVLVVLGLYRLKDHRPTAVVASLELYRTLVDLRSRPQSPRQWFSIFVQLLVFAALLFALSEPIVNAASTERRHVFILFDTSASMLAREGRVTRVELAKQRLVTFIESLDANTEVSLATADVALTPRVPWTHERAPLQAAVAELHAVPLPSEVPTCLEQAAQFLEGKSRPELLIVTDATRSAFAPLTLPAKLRHVKRQALLVGTRQNNVAILGFAPRRNLRSPADTSIALTLGNFGAERRHVIVELFVDDRLVQRRNVELEGFETKPYSLNLTLGQAHRLRTALRFESGKSDALSIDDEAFAWLGSPRRSRLLVRTPGNLYLEAAILADPWVTPQFVPLDAPKPSVLPDAVIVDGGAIQRPLTRPTLWLNPDDKSLFVDSSKPLTQIGFDAWERNHPILQQLELFDVQIASARRLKPQPGDHILAKSGNHPILLESSLDGQPLVILGFDPKQSDFVLRPDFPIFIEQVNGYLLGGPSLTGNNALAGHPLTLTLPNSKDMPSLLRQLRTPSGRQDAVTITYGQGTYVPEELGIYELSSDSNDVSKEYYAVNLFSTLESQLEPVRPWLLDGTPVTEPNLTPRRETSPLSLWLALFAFGLLAVEWLAFHRRVLV